LPGCDGVSSAGGYLARLRLLFLLPEATLPGSGGVSSAGGYLARLWWLGHFTSSKPWAVGIRLIRAAGLHEFSLFLYSLGSRG